MTRLLTTGFEAGSFLYDEFAALINAPAIQNTTVRSGNWAADLGNGGKRLRWLFPVAEDEFYLRTAIYPHAGHGPGENMFLQFRDAAGGYQITVERQVGATNIRVFRGDHGGAVLGSGGDVPDDEWSLIEIYLKIDDVAGRCVVRVGEVEVIDFTGDTQATANAEVSIVAFGSCPSWPEHFLNCYMDDIGINNTDGAEQNSWLGDGRIIGKAVVSDGTHTAWTASAGARHECVDDPADDSEYIYALNVGDKCSFNMAASGLESYDNVSLVCMHFRGGLAEGGHGNIKPLIRIGGADYNGTEKTVYPGPHGWQDNHAISPATVVAWTVDELDAAEFGVEVA